MTEEEKVCFDPGFSAFALEFPTEIPQVLDELTKFKQPHQKKFMFQRLETQVIPIIKKSASLYLGCILWGCYLHFRYISSPKEISGNIIKEHGLKPDYEVEMDYILENIEKLNKAANFYLKRPVRIPSEVIGHFVSYKKFVSLNDSFLSINTTADIKIPDDFLHFQQYRPEKLDELKESIYKIIKSGNIEGILGL